jgi:alpha-glucosidase (family GH31 glycosyl hydrolase)
MYRSGSVGRGLVSAASTLCLLLAAACADRGGGSDGGQRFQLRDVGAAFEVSSGALVVSIDKQPFALHWKASGGRVVSEAPRGSFFVSGGTRVFLDRVTAATSNQETASFTVDSAAGTAIVEVSFAQAGVARIRLTPPAEAGATSAGERIASPDDEAIYGLIERTVSDYGDSELIPKEVGSLDRRGTKVTMQVLMSEGLYTPFFQTSRGYGLLVAGTTIGKYDLAATDPGAIELEFELPPGVEAFEYLFIDGPSHDQIVDRYTEISGRPFLPPEWAFKHWRWRDEHRLAAPATLDGVAMNADLVDDLTHYEQLGIPAGNYTIDRPWGTGDVDFLQEPEEPGFGDLIWDEQRFPNPQATIDALNRRGYHLFLWVAPWATGVNTNAEARAGGYLAPGSNFIIDYTKPEAVEWWAGKVKPLIEMGIAGLKLDRGDEDTPSLAVHVYADGRTGRELRNAYPELFAKVHYDIVRSVRGDDFLVYPRSGYAGSQRWAVFSAGDVPGKDITGKPTDLGLRSVILSVQHNAFNGFPIWGSDTGGYEQFGDREVFARWIELSAFCPIMEIGGVGTHAPWDMPTEPHYDQEMIDIYRQYVNLHHALVGYTYRHAQEASRSGRPIAKPLVFDYADDPRVKDLWQEYLYGDDILVAPVWKLGQRNQHVYLPAGRWVDYWDRTRVVAGPADLDEPAPLDRIPIFIREGAEVLGAL